MQQKAGVRPMTHHNLSLDLATTVRGIHAFQAYCACGWEGRACKTYDEARREKNRHRFDRHT